MLKLSQLQTRLVLNKWHGLVVSTIFWDTLGYFTWKQKETTFIFRVPEKKQLYISGTKKETTFLKRGYFKKRKRERKVVNTISGLEGGGVVLQLLLISCFSVKSLKRKTAFM